MNATTSDRYRLQVATLAESTTATTCSALVARRFRLGIVPSGSFEEAIALVKAGLAEMALVPGAFPGIGRFYYDPELRLISSFAAEIPAIVLATKPKGRWPFRQIFAPPATKPVWYLIHGPVTEVTSNDVAAASVDSRRTACITNAVAATSAGLIILRELRPESPMSWNLFARTHTSNSEAHIPLFPTPASRSRITQSAAPLQLQPIN